MQSYAQKLDFMEVGKDELEEEGCNEEYLARALMDEDSIDFTFSFECHDCLTAHEKPDGVFYFDEPEAPFRTRAIRRRRFLSGAVVVRFFR